MILLWKFVRIPFCTWFYINLYDLILCQESQIIFFWSKLSRYSWSIMFFFILHVLYLVLYSMIMLRKTKTLFTHSHFIVFTSERAECMCDQRQCYRWSLFTCVRSSTFLKIAWVFFYCPLSFVFRPIKVNSNGWKCIYDATCMHFQLLLHFAF